MMMKKAKKSGVYEYADRINSKSAPLDLRIRRILFPVTKRT
jgi:hypothetical protein